MCHETADRLSVGCDMKACAITSPQSHLLLKVRSALVLYCRSVCIPSTCACVWRQATWLASLLVRSTSTRTGYSASVKTSKLDPRARHCCCVMHLHIRMMFHGDQQQSSTSALIAISTCSACINSCCNNSCCNSFPGRKFANPNWCLKVLRSCSMQETRWVPAKCCL